MTPKEHFEINCPLAKAAKVRPTTSFEEMYIIDILQDSETVVKDTRKDNNLPNSTTPRSEKNQGSQKVSNDTRIKSCPCKMIITHLNFNSEHYRFRILK